MDTKEILEREKKIAMKAALIATNPVLGRVLATVPEKIFDGLIAMSESKKEKQEEPEESDSDNEGQRTEKNTVDLANQNSQNCFWNFLKILPAKKIGSVTVLGPKSSGKTTLWQSADQIYNHHNLNYSCHINYGGNFPSDGETELRVPKKRFTTGRFILPTDDGNITFYTPADACGSRDGQRKTLNKDLDKSSIIIFCFDLEWLYNEKQIPLTEDMQVGISEYLRVWTKYVLATLKIKKEKIQKQKRIFVYLATHADANACKKSNDADSTIRDKMKFNSITEYIQAYNQDISCDSIQYDFVKGSFDTCENAEIVWQKLTRAMSLL